jgi:hypothetical protein
MKRIILILFFAVFSTWAFAQDDTHVVDSLLSVLPSQEGREKVITMIELTWDFFDVSFDDCIIWGEKAVAEAQSLNQPDLEAEANYTLGVQYAQHSDLDLAKQYLYLAYSQYIKIDDSDYIREFGWDFSSTKFAFLSLWNMATYELTLGNIDTAFLVYQKALPIAEQMEDTLACAQVNDNLAFIQYQRNDFEGAIKAYESSRDIYALLNDSLAVAKSNLNIAVILGESGRAKESRELFVKVIPELEVFQEKYLLLTAYKNYGMLFARDFINYDSASYYFEKALACVESETLSPADRQTMDNTKSDLLVEMGNVAVNCHDELLAMNYFKEALALAEKNKYHFGLMQAALSLGQLYAYQGKASLSLHYLEIYADEAKKSGITMMESAAKKPLIMDYARLGRFDEMKVELDALDEQKQALQRENNDLYDQLSTLQDETQGLLSQYESQNDQIQTLQSQRNHYRLAFFGLLAIALFSVVLMIAYKIVRKKRTKV